MRVKRMFLRLTADEFKQLDKLLEGCHEVNLDLTSVYLKMQELKNRLETVDKLMRRIPIREE